MQKITIDFEANEQTLTRTSELIRVSSGTQNYLTASFRLGANWQNFDKVYAIWHNSFDKEPSLLDSESRCIIPSSVLDDIGTVRVNLEGIKGEAEAVLTTYTTEAVIIDERVPIDGEESEPLKR